MNRSWRSLITGGATIALSACGATIALSACGASRHQTPPATPQPSTPAAHHARSPPARPAQPRVLAVAGRTTVTPFVPAVRWRGATVAYVARSSGGVALLSFDQRHLTIALHSGTIDAGGSGWRYGPEITNAERPRLVAAFNGGFKFTTGAGGFMSAGRTAVPLRPGLASIVTYADGRTDIGAWRREVPAPGEHVVSVRQNLTLLLDHGRAASDTGCVACWGATLGGVTDPARSALGTTADGHLIWAGGEHLGVADLAAALLSARVVRAAELDINPEWVASYLYDHGRRRLTVVPIVPGQPGVPGQFLQPYGRDFFTVLTR